MARVDDNELAARYMPRAMRIAKEWARHSGKHLREEFESAAMLALCEAIKTYPQFDGAFETLLDVAVAAEMADVLRRESKHYDGREEDSESALSEVLARQEINIGQLLEGLPPAERKLITAYYLDGDTLEVIATRDGVSVMTAWRRVRRAVEKLRDTGA